MKRALRWLRNGLLGIVALFLVAALVVYIVSERIARRTYDAPGTPVSVPGDSASIREGERLARIRGCTGCHGAQLAGEVFGDNALLGLIVSPNLTVAAREYTDPELERIIRHGIRPDGRSVVLMPSGMFSVLDDADFGRIIAYVRSVPRVPGHPREVRLGPLPRLMFALGKFEPAAVEAHRAAALSRSFPSGSEPMARGAYLARTACTECHGFDLRGGNQAPDLRIAAGYSRDAFTHLMRTGKALGDRELKLMSKVARSRFSHFTDSEIAALHDYLLARAAGSETRGPKPD
ncbi:MAG: c-type cytochrome [Gemmatimonadota bacterium]|nr:c-type cytochrome [Gemmatimonadota bacterium]